MSEIDREDINKLITSFMVAISNCTLYSKEHELFERSTERALSILLDLLIVNKRIEITIVDDDLIINRTPIKDRGLHGTNLIRRLKRMGISHISFLEGIDIEEFRGFIIDIAEMNGAKKRYPHINTGVVDVHLETGGDDDRLDRGLSLNQVEMVQAIFRSISPFKVMNTIGIEEIVLNFVRSLEKDLNILKLLSHDASQEGFLYIHAMDVSILSIFLAESVGINGKALYDVGISALLHDVGWLLVPEDMRGSGISGFDEDPYHPIYGAIYLAKAKGLTRLAPVVAFEHHRGYDGTGYPVLRANQERPHICSQIVAIADFFDNMRRYDLEETLRMMNMKSDKTFNPFLLDVFIKNIKMVMI